MTWYSDEDYEKLEKIPEIMDKEWKTPKEVAEEIQAHRGLVRAILYWLSAEKKHYHRKYVGINREVTVLFQRVKPDQRTLSEFAE